MFGAQYSVFGNIREAIGRHPKFFWLLLDVYVPRGVCSSRLLLKVPWASQVINFL